MSIIKEQYDNNLFLLNTTYDFPVVFKKIVGATSPDATITFITSAGIAIDSIVYGVGSYTNNLWSLGTVSGDYYEAIVTAIITDDSYNEYTITAVSGSSKSETITTNNTAEYKWKGTNGSIIRTYINTYIDDNPPTIESENIYNTSDSLTENREVDTGLFTLELSDDSAAAVNLLKITKNGNSGNSLNIFQGNGNNQSIISATGSVDSFTPAINFSNNGQATVLSVSGNSGDGALPILAVSTDSDTNTVVELLRLQRQCTVAGAAGIGGSINFELDNDNSSSSGAGEIVVLYTDVTQSLEFADMSFILARSGTKQEIFRLKSNGTIVQNSITGPQATALTPELGMEVVVSSIDGVFTSIGKWGYNGSAWVNVY